MPTLPSQFDSTPALALLRQVAQGEIGFDLRLIDSLLRRPAETLDALDQFASAVRTDDLVDLGEQIFDLHRAIGSPRSLPYFLSLLERSEPGDIPDELIEAISVHREAAVEPLLELRAKMEGSQEHGADIVFVLAALGVRDPRVASLLRETLARDPYEGALCIGLSQDASLKPDVEAALAALPEDAAEERKVLAECAESLSREYSPEPPPEFNIRELYPEQALPLFDQMKVETVLEFLEVEDPLYRACAARSFLDEQYGDSIRDRLLRLAESDPSPAVRGGAFRSLGERIDEPAVRALMTARLADADDPAEREGLLVGLAGAAQLAEVHKAILDAWKSPEMRAAALEAMWRSFDERYIPYFADTLSADDPEVRRQGVQGVAAFSISDLAIELVPLFEDDELRDEALFAYALAAPGKNTPKGVEKLLEEIREKAGGLSHEEEASVAGALDRRLERAGAEPHFFPEEPPPPPAVSSKVGRNDPCPCGSGKKYKKCCGA